MPLYACPVCAHMPTEHGPEGCTATAVFAGDANPRRQPCPCRAMVNGELVQGITAAEASSSGTKQRPASSSSHHMEETKRMGWNDVVGEGGAFAKADEKDELIARRTPMEIYAAPAKVTTTFVDQRATAAAGHTVMQESWNIPVRLLRWDGSQLVYETQEDGEGGQTYVSRMIGLGSNSRRDHEMASAGRWLSQNSGQALGPLKMIATRVQGIPQPVKGFADWTPADAQQAQPVYMPPPAAPVIPVPPPPPADLRPPPPPPPPPPPVDEYQYQTFNGQPHRWKPGMAGWELVPQSVVETPPGTIPPPQPLPGQTSQPLPGVKALSGYVNSEGMGTEQVTVMGADGSQMRQAVYQGDGRVMQPNGNETQNVVGMPEPRQGALSDAQPGAQSAVLGVDPQAPAPTPQQPPQPLQQGVQGNANSAYAAGKAVAVTLHCPECLKDYNTPAFKSPGTGKYIQSHVCPKAGKMLQLDADEAVRVAAGIR